MAANQNTRDMILNSIPQQHPFRFIDEILELDESSIVGSYRFRAEKYFYKGYFPDCPDHTGILETKGKTHGEDDPCRQKRYLLISPCRQGQGAQYE